jgi:hypothetical protein
MDCVCVVTNTHSEPRKGSKLLRLNKNGVVRVLCEMVMVVRSFDIAWNDMAEVRAKNFRMNTRL